MKRNRHIMILYSHRKPCSKQLPERLKQNTYGRRGTHGACFAKEPDDSKDNNRPVQIYKKLLQKGITIPSRVAPRFHHVMSCPPIVEIVTGLILS